MHDTALDFEQLKPDEADGAPRSDTGEIEDKEVAQYACEHVAILHPLISSTRNAVTD
jgi:hypothetical protein